MITLKRTDGSIIAECDTDSMVDAVYEHRAYLYGANLSGANLCEAYLYGANLSGANLCEAYLYGANLSGANLCEAYLYGARGIISIGPIASEGRIIYVVNHGDNIMVKAGCFWGDLEEFKKAVEEKHGTNEHGEAYMAAIEFILAYAKAYKWSEEKDQ